MYLVVDVEKRDVWLRDPDVFSSFHIVAIPRDAPEDEIAAALGDEGAPAGDAHLWIAVHAPRRLLGPRVTDEWEEGFAEMLDHARERGWMNGAGTQVRAHIQR